MRHVYRFVIKHSYERAMEGWNRGGVRRSGTDRCRRRVRERKRGSYGGVIAVRPVGTRHRCRRPRSFGCDAMRCDATRRVASRR